MVRHAKILTMEIRKFLRADVEVLLEVKDFDFKELASLLYRNKSLREQSYLLTINNEDIGFMATERTLSMGILVVMFYIFPKYRKQGIATKFFKTVITNFEVGYTFLCYYNKRLSNFYKKLGFTPNDNLTASIYTINL